MSAPVVFETFVLGRPPWPTMDPFLFCVHHHDDYPSGTEAMGLTREQLDGRRLGMDFSGKDGWSLYHGHPIPGFPRHPHRGFETVTLARADGTTVDREVRLFPWEALDCVDALKAEFGC